MGGPVLLLLKLMVLSSNLLASSRALRRPSTRHSRTAVGQGLRTTTSSRARTRIIKAELTVWVVFICFVWVESIVDRTIAWAVPFYGQIKIIVLLFLWTLKRAASHLAFGSQIVFKQIKRYMRRYEGPIDALGYALGQVIELLLAALVFLPSLLWSKWAPSRQPDVPSILAGLNSPRRGPMANRLAAAVQKSTSTSTTDSKNNNIKVTARTVVIPTSTLAPSAKLKRTLPTPITVESRLQPLSTTLSAKEQRSLLASTSSRATPIASSSSSLYPSLSSVPSLPAPLPPPVPALRQSSSRLRVVSDRQKGKQRAVEVVSDDTPPEAPSSIASPPRSPSTPPKKAIRRRSTPRRSTPRRSLHLDESLDANQPVEVEIQVDESAQVDTPRASPLYSKFFPQTPAPPGAFVSTPLKNETLGSTARQQASSALKGLANDLWGLGEDARPMGASPLASRNKTLLNGKASVSKRTGGSVLQTLEASKSNEEELGKEGVGDRRKRKAVRAPSVEPPPPASKRRTTSSLSSSTSSRQLGSSDALSASTKTKPSSLAGSVSGASRSTRMRGRVGEDSSSSILSRSRSTSTSTTSISKAHSLKAPAKELLPPPTALNRTTDSNASTGTLALKRRAKRVLGRGASVDVEDEQVEMDGVPVVKRRR
ncbi:BZ3500_MvSof-1268-A1-R1_Chr5-1g07615 [Microbotryum saponariae]|uniref:BZ3500_MvSof-1268-A1-R1_Chr5-1g07615 protein n=1 Tax=Microbotryum saponariae TaxID=289078 RepID=A0A2X0NIH1_9BASI|nr:BZ3500_MvSof-1268-A1-R1_Chr5-1g07615 [Microbotryum saponariae]SDA05486.1 BZ3501_MvSof-1269-A2-R1_Chr5-2g07439 [Microbotryum saponariae]